MRRDAASILVKPILTEKAVAGSQQTNTYVFEVALRSNKIEIRKAVESSFKVRVLDVRTAKRRGGTRRFGHKRTTQAAVKHAYVTLAEGDRIDLL